MPVRQRQEVQAVPRRYVAADLQVGPSGEPEGSRLRHAGLSRRPAHLHFHRADRRPRVEAVAERRLREQLAQRFVDVDRVGAPGEDVAHQVEGVRQQFAVLVDVGVEQEDVLAIEARFAISARTLSRSGEARSCRVHSIMILRP